MKSTHGKNTKGPAPTSKPFALAVNEDFCKKAMRVMGLVPELLSGEFGSLREPSAHHFSDPAAILDAGINAALVETGALLGVSRAYVMLDEHDGRYLRNTHEWVDGKIGPAMFSWPLHSYEKDLPSLKPMMTGKDFLAAHTAELPPDFQRVMSMQGVDSALLVPLLREGSWIGLVGFDSCGVERVWREEEIVILKHLARCVVLFLERLKYAEALHTIKTMRELLGDGFSSDSSSLPDSALKPPVARIARAAAKKSKASGDAMSLLEAERQLIIDTLARCNGNKTHAAKQLGIKWGALDRRCRKLGIKVK